jgi:predicted transport protein
MEEINLIKPEKISLQNHQIFNEKRLQEIIAKDPSILGLGDLILKDKERNQPKAGRLDLLLQDSESELRYEVEIQLGKTDESHIIRTIEYWDIEKKRFPQYEHYAVIIAEDITSRFLNVISLLNGSIPVIAIQVNAYKFEDKYFLIFTKILNEINLGYSDEDEGPIEITDRNYWETIKGTKETVETADRILSLIKTFSPEIKLNYTKFYIGLIKNGKAYNFATLRPKKHFLKLEIKLDKTNEIDKIIDDSGIDVLDYNNRYKKYRFSLKNEELIQYKDLITKLLKLSYDNFGN